MNIKEIITAVAGLVLVMVTLIWYYIAKIWGTGHWILMIAGLLLLGYFIFGYYRQNKDVFSARSFKYGSNTLIQVLVVVLIIGLLAFITTSRNYRADWTANKLYGLSDQSMKILDSLEQDVNVKAFYKSSDARQAKDVLDEYAYRSSNLAYEIIDPDEQPDIRQQYGITQYNTVVVEAGPKSERIPDLTEMNLTNAIIKVTREQDKVIYFLTGHGEGSINDESPKGFKRAAETVKTQNHLVREINLAQRRSIPDSCTVLVIVSPKSAFFPFEWDSIASYLDRGGKVLLLADQDQPADVYDFVNKYNIRLGRDLVIDNSGFGQLFGAGPAIPLVRNYDESHAITREFSIMSFFPYASSVRETEAGQDFRITKLLQTGANSWADTDWSAGSVEFSDEDDTAGPITLAALAEKDLANGKLALAVFGDSDFASNAYFDQQGNGNLFLNTINYLAEEEDLISIRPKEMDDRRITMTEAEISGLLLITVIGIPIAMVILGVVVFILRNRA